MNKSSEALDLARTEYINGYEEKDTTIFPTLNLIAKEFSLSLSTLRKKAANEGWYKKRKQHQNAREEYEIRKQFKGKYSKFLCDDDWLEPSFIEESIDLMEMNDASCSISNINVIKVSNKKEIKVETKSKI